MDGYTATQEIRLTLKLTTPIIAMTAHAFAGEREKCFSYGMNEYISKPISEEKLHDLITQFIKVKTSITRATETSLNFPAGEYKYIDLHYMREVSGGNVKYERTVTEQFIDIIPHDLLMLEKYWQDGHIGNMRQQAHNMKTTVSVMGLNEALQPYLDSIEYEDLSEESFKDTYLSLKLICDESIREARHFYSIL
ncbi:MAG: response regulator [Ginsengibacter sp.]